MSRCDRIVLRRRWLLERAGKKRTRSAFFARTWRQWLASLRQGVSR